jgi:hypothetical protein
MIIKVNGMGRVHLLSKEANEFLGLLRVYVRTTKHIGYYDGSKGCEHYEKRLIEKTKVSVVKAIKRR